MDFLEKHKMWKDEYCNILYSFILNNLDNDPKKLICTGFEVSKNLTWNFVKNNPNIDWNYDDLLQNPNTTLDRIKELISLDVLKYKSSSVYHNLSRNPNITWEIIKNNPNLNWNYKHLSSHKNITWDIVKNNP